MTRIRRRRRPRLSSTTRGSRAAPGVLGSGEGQERRDRDAFGAPPDRPEGRVRCPLLPSESPFRLRESQSPALRPPGHGSGQRFG